jgi:hypothetical protein
MLYRDFPIYTTTKDRQTHGIDMDTSLRVSARLSTRDVAAYGTACFCPMPGITYKMISGLGRNWRIQDETWVGRFEDKK